MLTVTQRLRPRTEEVASQIMEGEAIIINLASGVYYSLDKVGCLVWEQIGATRTVSELVSAVAARYDVTLAQAQTDIERLIGELFDEKMIAPLDGEPDTIADLSAIATPRLSYEPPVLNIYRDMGDLLALDPPTPGLDSPWRDQA